MDPTTRPPRATSPASPASGQDLSGQKWGDFRILRLLGQGGMGQVYLAEQVSLKRKVAIKLLREDVAANPTALERFKAESKTVARLSHAHVVQVHTVGEYEGRHYMVLEYVEGQSLRDYLLRKGPLDVPLVLSVMRQVAGALNRAGEMGIVHRDIKPENILLTRKGEAKVADFGLSRCLGQDQPLELTRDGTTVGTPMFMSPEQIEGKAVDDRSDIYSFGVTCYQMLAGRTPFTGSNAFEVALKHVREEPPPLETVRPDVPAALCAVVHKMMAKKRRDRYQSAHDLLKDIAGVRESLGGTTASIPVGAAVSTPVPTNSSWRSALMRVWRRRAVRRWGLAALAVGVVGLLFVGVATAWLLGAARHPAEVSAAPAAPQSASVVPAPAPDASAAPAPTPEGVVPPDGQKEREESLRKLVEQHLKDDAPNPAGVDDCIDLAVLYLDQNKVRDAEALFKRMDERRPPSSYYFVGRLGLAVTDALTNDSRGSHAKFAELFDAKSHDNRVPVLNDYLAKNPDFAKWVNEADSHNVRNGAAESGIPWDMHHFPGRLPFKKP